MDYKQFCKILTSKNPEIQKMVSDTWPRKAGITAVNQFKENYRMGGFLDKARTPWKRTKRQDNPKLTKSGKSAASSTYGPLLSARRHLMQETKCDFRDGEAIIQNNTPYASVHNEGGRAGRGHSAFIPKRQFIGTSQTLGEKIIKMIVKDLDKLFNH